MAFLDWSDHNVGRPLPCRLCGIPAMLRDEKNRPCHMTCAHAQADGLIGGDDQGDALAVVVQMPTAPVIDLHTRRRIA
ncbi:hypothetical protein [Dactylosporangium sp. NPDC050588]|uniref:hypothetical protein n=1 Tax=Dactylosporangium sp. NPDC050588 TaxID=3157211 RepID=UPI0033CC7D1E